MSVAALAAARWWVPGAAGLPPVALPHVIEIILDKGIAIDAYVRASLVGVKMLPSTPAS
jgi:hypothetical protein